MALSMRINFVDVICDNSLRNRYVDGRPVGYEFQVRLSNYRGHFLSCIDSFGVTVDGEEVDNRDVMFCLNGKEFCIEQLSDLSTEFWDLIEPAVIRVHRRGGLGEGEHEIKLKLYLRVPYLPLPGAEGERSYVPLDSCGEKTMVISSRKGE